MLGRAFQSPFTKPSGRGLSSSTVNVVWGFLNLVFSYLLLFHVGEFNLRAADDAVAIGLGMILMGVMMARHVGRFHGGNAPVAK